MGADTVRMVLHEFAHAYSAFAAFQDKADSAELGNGFYREKNDLIFYHGNFLGEMHYARAGLIPAHFLKENLVFKNEELFERPPEFQAFPLSGRISKSERVISRHFLGKAWQGPVFSVQYRCDQDTATAFRAYGQAEDSVKDWLREWKGKMDTLNWGREIHFQGENDLKEALLFWVFPEGILGIVGCYDPILASTYAQKMQKMTVLLAKP